MRVERDLLHHPKLVKLKALSGNPAAVEWLLALWGYCEKARAWRFDDMPPERLADACLAIIDGEKLLSFLRSCRWVELDGKTLVVRKWDHWNAGYIQRWGAWKAGQEKRLARSSPDTRPIDSRPIDARSSPDSRPRARLNEGKKEYARGAAQNAPGGRLGGENGISENGRLLRLVDREKEARALARIAPIPHGDIRGLPKPSPEKFKADAQRLRDIVKQVAAGTVPPD